MEQDVNTSEVSESCGLTRDGDQSLITHTTWKLKGNLQFSVPQINGFQKFSCSKKVAPVGFDLAVSVFLVQHSTFVCKSEILKTFSSHALMNLVKSPKS